MIATGRFARVFGRRLGEVVIVALIVTTVSSLMVQVAPGDPARTILGARATPESVQALREQMGLDEPVAQQILESFGRLAHGDLGTSLVNRGQSVGSTVANAFPITASVIGFALGLAMLVGLPLGLIAAATRRRWLDRAISASALGLLSVPPFVLGLFLLLVMAIGLKVAPAGGWGDGWPDHFRYLWLPSLALSGMIIPQLIRTVRQAASEILQHEFVDAALSRGLSQRRLVLRHVLPNSLLPVITVVGLNASILVAGAVVVEAVFGMPGVGGALVVAVQARDYPTIQGIALATALAVIVINLVTDLSYKFLDPRMRVG